jgi:dethiobiotin synthetase
MSILLVTGTDTGVGKTVVTAALAATATAAGCTVAVLKPAQTGVGAGEESDMDTVARLAGPALVKTLAEYPDPLAPAAAARASGRPPLVLDSVLTTVTELRAAHDVVLIEGAGGLLVPMGLGWNTADLAQQLGGPVIVVAHAGLGTLNHTGLTLEALSRRGIPAFVVIGSWPARPELVHRANLTDLPGSRVGVVPEGVSHWAAERFRTSAPRWFSAEFVEEVLTGDDD